MKFIYNHIVKRLNNHLLISCDRILKEYNDDQHLMQYLIDKGQTVEPSEWQEGGVGGTMVRGAVPREFRD